MAACPGPEGFIIQLLKARIMAPLTVHAHESTSLDLAGEVVLRPDVVIPSDHHPVLVADCKYKRLDVGEHRHHDHYQLLAYGTALDVCQGLLIYPKHLAPVSITNVIRHSDVVMSEVAIDLSGDLDELSRSCLALVKTVLALALAKSGQTQKLVSHS
jgi:5-methylcytosine-specific restriction enzyme subunit McrC